MGRIWWGRGRCSCREWTISGLGIWVWEVWGFGAICGGPHYRVEDGDAGLSEYTYAELLYPLRNSRASPCCRAVWSHPPIYTPVGACFPLALKAPVSNPQHIEKAPVISNSKPVEYPGSSLFPQSHPWLGATGASGYDTQDLMAMRTTVQGIIAETSRVPVARSFTGKRRGCSHIIDTEIQHFIRPSQSLSFSLHYMHSNCAFPE